MTTNFSASPIQQPQSSEKLRKVRHDAATLVRCDRYGEVLSWDPEIASVKWTKLRNDAEPGHASDAANGAADGHRLSADLTRRIIRETRLANNAGNTPIPMANAQGRTRHRNKRRHLRRRPRWFHPPRRAGALAGGAAWRRLHRLVYLVAALAALHFLWLAKAVRSEQYVYAAIVALLLGIRLLDALRRRLRRRQSARDIPAPLLPDVRTEPSSPSCQSDEKRSYGVRHIPGWQRRCSIPPGGLWGMCSRHCHVRRVRLPDSPNRLDQFLSAAICADILILVFGPFLKGQIEDVIHTGGVRPHFAPFQRLHGVVNPRY